MLQMIHCIVSLFYWKGGINYSCTLWFYVLSFRENVIDTLIHPTLMCTWVHVETEGNHLTLKHMLWFGQKLISEAELLDSCLWHPQDWVHGFLVLLGSHKILTTKMFSWLWDLTKYWLPKYLTYESHDAKFRAVFRNNGNLENWYPDWINFLFVFMINIISCSTWYLCEWFNSYVIFVKKF